MYKKKNINCIEKRVSFFFIWNSSGCWNGIGVKWNVVVSTRQTQRRGARAARAQRERHRARLSPSFPPRAPAHSALSDKQTSPLPSCQTCRASDFPLGQQNLPSCICAYDLRSTSEHCSALRVSIYVRN